MVLGWRRAFCTSIPRDREPTASKDKQEQLDPSPSPKRSSKFGFFSNPSTPRCNPQSQPPVSSPRLRCTTSNARHSVSAPDSPKLQCKTKNSPRFFHRSNPSSPRSPSTFSFLKSSLWLTKQSRCGICLLTVKTGQGTAIFTAECSHCFHFPCVAAHVKKQGTLSCPVCSSKWKELPLLSVHDHQNAAAVEEKIIHVSPRFNVDARTQTDNKHSGKPVLKVYNDDEPLMSPTSGVRFNPIPESDEECEGAGGEFQGFFVTPKTSSFVETPLNVEARLLPEAAVVSVGRSYETYAIVLKLRAPRAPGKTVRRAPIDLVTVLDVSGKMTVENLQMMKRSMRLVLSLLSSSDRLSIVAFSSTSKRLLPLRRMTTAGRRAARRIVEAIVALEGTTASASDALKKAAKVLEDRRERNPVASIMLLSDDRDDRSTTRRANHSSFISSSCTRFSQHEIPVHRIGLTCAGTHGHAPSEEVIAKCIGGLLNLVVQDLRVYLGFVPGSAPAEIAAVYSCTGRPAALGSGSAHLGDLYGEEEREVLVELKVPSMAVGAHHILSVRCSYQDPSTQEIVYCKEQALLVPRPHVVRSSSANIERLRYLFIATRAVAESRRLVERTDLKGAHQMLASARALLLQSSSASANELLRGLESELSELLSKCQSQVRRTRRTNVEREEERSEPLTPTSAWRAAERLAKVAIMRKSLNRVSDLHGFENARF